MAPDRSGEAARHVKGDALPAHRKAQHRGPSSALIHAALPFDFQCGQHPPSAMHCYPF
ncbi:hypothetical protein BURKHO8Y_60071 [Burkholderia sp. 8Y]|nr:hypothetical protein BURKHO8Y_60071 [Burkholderia sp. 8Y]